MSFVPRPRTNRSLKVSDTPYHGVLSQQHFWLLSSCSRPISADERIQNAQKNFFSSSKKEREHKEMCERDISDSHCRGMGEEEYVELLARVCEKKLFIRF
ncbi:hypothetical protein JTE90_011876 [Oedothorax gibbosus]|uniref:Uncharacterized protein n=1 Tax=Oedothorax gibbosus TaxID=931172 RepID=A0AAV6V504_9ARAC|nr:hypothetical protein JTE90_011876 [Oedothorax gibbosus]